MSVELVSDTLSAWSDAYGQSMPKTMLCDLRDVAGYGPGCGTLVREWLRRANDRGVERIAFLGSSSVLRTATRLLAPRVGVELRTFQDERDARRWLRAAEDVPPPERAQAQI